LRGSSQADVAIVSDRNSYTVGEAVTMCIATSADSVVVDYRIELSLPDGASTTLEEGIALEPTVGRCVSGQAGYPLGARTATVRVYRPNSEVEVAHAELTYVVVEAPEQSVAPLPPPQLPSSFDISQFVPSILVADDGALLGEFGCNPFGANDIANEFGDYGSEFSSTSILNDFGTYGGEFSSLSPFNDFTSTPPALIRDGRVIGHLTTNEFISGAIDTRAFLAAYFSACA
jgi:hypothetical protein